MGNLLKIQENRCSIKKIKKINTSISNYSPSSRLGHAFNYLKNNSDSLDLSSKLDLSSSFNKFSSIECVSIMSFLHLSVGKYKILSKFLKSKNIDILCCYDSILNFKKQYIYLPLTQSECLVKVSLASLLNNSIPSLINFAQLDEELPIEIFTKYGGDGLTDGSDYKIIKRKEETCDKSTFVMAICFLKIKQNGSVLFKNPSPSSNLYLRPVSMHLFRETSNFIQGVFRQIRIEIEQLNSFDFTFEGRRFTIKTKFLPSMNDGKVVNALEGITYSRKCFICHEQGERLIEISPEDSTFISTSIFKYGLQPLHILIRATEWVLKISYSLGSEGMSTAEKNEYIDKRRSLIHNRIVSSFWLNVDVPSIKNGRTTDGNMARRLFSQHQQFSSLLELDNEFVKNIACLLACLS